MSEERIIGTLSSEANVDGIIAVGKGDKGDKGDTYTITSADYAAIAQIAEEEYATDLNEVKTELSTLGLTVDAQGNVIDIWESEV